MMAPHSIKRSIQKHPVSYHFNFFEKKFAVQWQCSRLCFCLIASSLLGALALVGVLDAQQASKKNPAQDSVIVLQQTVRRVRVDVVVTDAQGRPVAGLQASDFRVAEDRKPQSIRQFEWHSDENPQPALPKRPQLPPHTFMNLPEAPEHGPLTVLLYDALNTPVDDQPNARAQMLEFLKKSAGRRIAIFYLGDRLRVLQGFTSDAGLLVQAVNQTNGSSSKGYWAEPAAAPTARPDHAGPSDRKLPSEVRSEEAEENARLVFAAEAIKDRVNATLEALVQISRFLADLPGRKNLIWYSGSFPAGILPDTTRTVSPLRPGSLVRDDSVRDYTESMKNTTNLLNAAEVSIYPIDARGLLTDTPFERRSAEFATMDLIGEQTGGQAFHGTNGLKEALETAADEGSSYYSLVYAPTNMKFDGSLRHIAVRLGRGHYNLAYRRSYFAADRDTGTIPQTAADQEDALAESTTAASQFGAPPSHQLVFAVQVDAVGEPVPATAEQMAALAPYQEKAAKAERIKFVPQTTPASMRQYVIQYGVLAKQLVLPRSANGVYHSDLSMAALAFNQDGATLWGAETRLKADIPSSKIDSIRKDGFRAAQTFFIPVDIAVLRFVVRDEQSGRVGSMEVRLPLPPDQRKSVATR
jgi:VWFA-related protein